MDNDILTNPGQGAFGFIKVVESVIIPVESRQVTTVFVVSNTTAVATTSGATFEFVAASLEVEVLEEYRLFLRVVDDVLAGAEQAESETHLPHAGEGTEEYPLDIEYLDEPFGIFRERKFPNGHYRIYLEEIRTGRIRLILDIHIYEGRVVPENFRDGAAERQPGSNDAPPPDDSSQLESVTDPLAVSHVKEAELTPGTGEGEKAVGRATALDQGLEADPNDNASVVRRSSVLLPAAAAVLPWGARVRKALRSETRSISRVSLRLRRHR